MTEISGTSIHDFENEAKFVSPEQTLTLQIEKSVSFMLDKINYLTDPQVARLLAALHTDGRLVGSVGVDGEVDISQEITMLMNTVRALREEVLVNGRIKYGVSIGEAHKVVNACGSMINTLMKHQEKAYSIERSRAVEESIISAIKETEEKLPAVKGLAELYTGILENRLESI